MAGGSADGKRMNKRHGRQFESWSMSSAASRLRGLLAVTLAAVTGLSLLGGASTACAQELWEFSPYRIRVWLAPAPHSMLTPQVMDEVSRTLHTRAEASYEAAWQLTVEAPPEEFRAEAAMRLPQLEVSQLVARAQLTPVKKSRARPPSAENAESKSAAPTSSGEAAPTADAKGGAAPAASGSTAPTPPAGESATSVAASDPAAGKPADGTAAAADDASAKRVDPTTSLMRELLADDKLFVVSVVPQGGDWLLTCRELDCRSRAWGAIQQRRVPDLALAPATAWELIQATFRPIARLETAKDKEAKWRLRAGGLVIREGSPLVPAVESMWRPYIRMNDRFGEPRTGVVPPLPWTFAIAKSREGTLLTTEVHTGVRNALLGRTTSRTQRFALQVRPTGTQTMLQLRSTDKTAETMSGYDVLAKDPRAEETKPLGRTDWRGAMMIPSSDYPLRVLYLKNGNQLLARLPMIPGLEPTLIADLAGDDRRLQVEGFIAGMQGKIMDLVARRAIVSQRIKRRANEGKLDEAAKLLDEFRALTTKEELTRQIDQAQVKFTSPNKRVQDKINKLFEDTRKLLDKFVKGGQLRDLETEVGGQAAAAGAAGTGGGGDSKPTPPAPKPGDGRAAGTPTAPPANPPTAPAQPGTGAPPQPPTGAPTQPPGVAPPGTPPGAPQQPPTVPAKP